MAEHTFEIDLSKAIGTGMIDVRDADAIYYRFEDTGATALSTAVMSYIKMLTVDDSGYDTTTITMDGTDGTIDASAFAFVRFETTTTEASKRGRLHLYTRRTTL